VSGHWDANPEPKGPTTDWNAMIYDLGKGSNNRSELQKQKVEQNRTNGNYAHVLAISTRRWSWGGEGEKISKNSDCISDIVLGRL
jgi:hypothetical protein